MVRLLAVIVSFFLFFAGASVTPYEFRDKDKLRFSAAVLSDMHTETNSTSRFHMEGNALMGVYSGNNRPDVIAFAGDNTMNGQALEWFDFYGLLGRFNRGSDVLVAMGNHDFGNTDDEDTYARLSKTAIASYNYYCKKNIDRVYYSSDYGCVKFIILGSENNAPDTLEVISDEQISWLKDQLGDCSERNIPAVVINHNLIYGKNGRQSYFHFNLTTNNDALENALTECGAKVIYICGHSHFGLGEGTVNAEGNVTYINLPSAGNRGNYDAQGDLSQDGIGLLLGIYDESVEITFRDFGRGIDFDDFSVSVPLGETGDKQ